MKNLLLFSLLFTLNVFSQNTYTLDEDAKIYDMPGGEFLTAVAVDDTIYLKHFNVAGNLIWEDSLTFSPAISPVYFSEIARFKNTDEYVISTFADPTPTTVWWQTFYNDTLVYQFTKINMNSHLITENVVDTFACKSMDMVELKDTSIYLLFSDYTLNANPFNQSTYSLNSAMDLSLIAPLDSVTTNPWGWSISVFGDSIYKHQSMEETNVMVKYNFQMSALETNWCGLTTPQDYHMSYYKRMFNKDSIFFLTQGTSSGSYAVQWRMDWMDLSLNSINYTIFNSPITNQAPLRYITGFYNSAIDRTNRKIMIMSTDMAPLPPNVVQKIFVYDFNFNLVCEIPVTIGSEQENTLIELNDLVYIRKDNSINSELYRVDCSMVALEALESTSEFELFPNPASSNVSISSSKMIDYIEIIDVFGRVLAIYAGINGNTIELDVSTLSNGNYFFKVVSGNTLEFLSFIKD